MTLDKKIGSRKKLDENLLKIEIRQKDTNKKRRTVSWLAVALDIFLPLFEKDVSILHANYFRF